MTRRIAVLAAWLFVGVVLQPVLSGEPKEKDELTGRAKLSKLIGRDLKSILLVEKVAAIRELGAETDATLAGEFKIVGILTDISTDNKRFPRERYEALRALVNLYKNGIGNPEILTTLSTMIEDNITPPIVRIGALGLLGEMGNFEGPIALKAFNTLEDLWAKRTRTRTRLPVPILAKILEAVGGFYKNEDSKKLLLEGLDEKSSYIRAGAMAGLQIYLEASLNADISLMKPVQRTLSKADTRAERTEAIRVLELIVQNEPAAADNLATSTKDALLKVLSTGGDAEVQAATRLLLRVPEEKILKAILAEARPSRSRKPTLSYETYHLLNAGLTEALRSLRETSTKASSKALSEDILKHFIWILDPNNQAPIVLRQAAIFGLGSWPTEFDRQMVVKVLIRLLEVAKTEDIIEETEKSLLFLTGREPFRTRDPETKQMVPDAKAWQSYYQQIAEFLKPNETPWEHAVEEAGE